MTWEDFADLDPRTVALLPVAAIEQHGPHLPVWVDTRINAGIVAEMLRTKPADLPVTVLPPMPVGKSVEHVDYPGTLTLSAETLARLWFEIGRSVARAGVKRMVIFNSHGGQPQVMEIVARDLRIADKMFVATATWWHMIDASDLFAREEIVHGIHAGAVETSMMMHLEPGLVREEKRSNFPSASIELARKTRFLSPENGSTGYGWMMRDLHASGAAGDARDADATRGRLLVERAAAALTQLLAEVSAYDPPY
jgi:creatinine amidohydrolase